MTAAVFECSIERVEQVGDEVKLFFLTKPEGFSFTPGQFCILSFDESFAESRAYSLASIPSDAFLLFGVKRHGEFSSRLHAMKEGARLFVKGPFGTYTLKRAKTKDLAFLAGGVGVTPFLGMIRQALEEGREGRLLLIYSVRTPHEIVQKEMIDSLAKKGAEDGQGPFRVVYVFTREAPSGEPVGRLDIDRLREVVSGFTLAETSFFVCGPKPFIASCKEMLSTLGTPPEHIIIESWG
ncbi:FAD-dependent oxidoreductase [Candidatus Woesearchaeota archaeon]|nr:MAG: FAD-dependent oxidoreductase [Candidatus Woesearchaeota archaeon]